MTTDVRTFTAETMQRALDIVRQEMGPDAVILHTRQIARRRLLPWLKSREEVEITAGAGVNVRAVAAKEAPTKSATPAVARRTISPDDLAPPPALLKSEPKAAIAAKPASVAATRMRTRAPMPAKAETLTPKAVTRATPDSTLSNPATAEIHKRLDALQQALAELTRQAKLRVADEVPVELFPHYTRLLDAGVDETTAREFAIRLKREATSDQLANPQACAALLAGMVEKEIRCAPPIKAVRGRRKVVALVGPTGVGKTTTLAKLAANFRLRDGLKVGLVTIDTYRVAAVEQLRTYAEIIDLPMKVVTSPPELRRALEELSGLDLVLIDTAGRSPNDELKLQELKSLLTDTGVDETYLVLSLAGGGASLEETAERFAGLKITSAIITKLDEAMRPGSLVTITRRVRWPINYVTAGQNVPEDIEPANAAKLAKWVLAARD
jgi:flagellar biosynthesis protein FlhF